MATTIPSNQIGVFAAVNSSTTLSEVQQALLEVVPDGASARACVAGVGETPFVTSLDDTHETAVSVAGFRDFDG